MLIRGATIASAGKYWVLPTQWVASNSKWYLKACISPRIGGVSPRIACVRGFRMLPSTCDGLLRIVSETRKRAGLFAHVVADWNGLNSGAVHHRPRPEQEDGKPPLASQLKMSKSVTNMSRSVFLFEMKEVFRLRSLGIKKRPSRNFWMSSKRPAVISMIEIL